MGTSLCVLYMNGCLSIECMGECSLSMYRYMFCDYACVLPSGDWDGNICFFNGLSDLCGFVIFVCVSVVYVLSVRCYYIDVCVLSLYVYVMCLLYRVVCVSY